MEDEKTHYWRCELSRVVVDRLFGLNEKNLLGNLWFWSLLLHEIGQKDSYK